MSGEPAPKWTPWVTYALIAANVAAFAYEIASGASATSPSAKSIYDLGANFGPSTLHGQPWRLVTAMFLHFGVMHIGMNMVCLYQARVAERVFGRLGFAALYVAAGLLGGIASLVRTTPVVSAGASGAVFGVYGAFAAFLLVRRRALEPKAWASMMKSVAIFVGANLALSLEAGIDMSAHVGGLVGGAAAGAWLLAGDPERALRQRALRSIATVVAGVALAVGGLVVLADRVPADVSGPGGYSWLGPSGALVDEFYRVDEATIAAYNAALTKAKAGQLTDAQLADEVDRDVIAPLRAFRPKLDTTPVPAEQHTLMVRVGVYIDRELVAYGDLVAASRDPAARTRVEQYKTDRAAADAAQQPIVDELQHLADAR